MHQSLVLLLVLLSFISQAGQKKLQTENVFLITTDGLRWQEVFTGAEEALLDKKAGVKNVAEMRRRFWRETSEERREALLPFFWKGIVHKGQIIGNQKLGSVAKVSNGLNFSYPGYNEMLTGSADSRINSNDKRDNPNVTVLEYVNQHPNFKGRVANFCTWDVFPYIINTKRSGLLMQTSWEPLSFQLKSEKGKIIQELIRDTTPIWENMTVDSLMYHSMMEYVDQEKPRLVFFSIGETDEWAHEGRYDQYLRSAHMFDRFLERMWDFVQSDRFYRNKTSFIILTDHGRGSGPHQWKDHGKDVAGAENIWFAVLSPDVPAMGERRNHGPVTQAQTAATIAELLGLDYEGSHAGAAESLLGVLRQGSRGVP